MAKDAERAQGGAGTGASMVTFGIGLALIAVGMIASAMLVLQGLGRMELPGCGLESACGRAASSAWGHVPGMPWLTTASLGLAYFLALLVAWAPSPRGVPPALRWVVRAGGLVSVVLVAAMLMGDYVCTYCLTVHIANLALVILIETRGAWLVRTAPVVSFGSAFVITVGAIGILEARHLSRREQRNEADLTQSMQQIIAKQPDPGDGDDASSAPFTGRYRIGPDPAAIRIVIISDYQCPDCRRMETEIRKILAERDDVSFSPKNFPFCVDCNDIAREHNLNLHPNACWAARAAETAGILGGEEGFWRMHRWLFDRGGGFTDAELAEALPSLGFDPATFVSTMQSRRTLDLVEADIEEATALGLRQTPMVFINGVELLGWSARDALSRAVEQLAATNPPPRTAAADHPPKALERHIRAWREERPRPGLAIERDDWTLGPADAPAEIILWGDYQEPYTAELDGRIRAELAKVPGVRYAFRHYPIDKSCNNSAMRTMHEFACRASQAAEAAGRLGGSAAYWGMHEWLMAHQEDFNDDALVAVAADLGLDAHDLFAEMSSTEVADAIRADAAAAKRLGLTGIPFWFVNGKYVPVWLLEGEPLPERIIEEGAAERQQASTSAGEQ